MCETLTQGREEVPLTQSRSDGLPTQATYSRWIVRDRTLPGSPKCAHTCSLSTYLASHAGGESCSTRVQHETSLHKYFESLSVNLIPKSPSAPRIHDPPGISNHLPTQLTPTCCYGLIFKGSTASSPCRRTGPAQQKVPDVKTRRHHRRSSSTHEPRRPTRALAAGGYHPRCGVRACMGRGSRARIQDGQRGGDGVARWHRRLSVRMRERTEESKLEITALCTASHNSDIVRSERKKLSEKLPRCEKKQVSSNIFRQRLF